MKNLLIRISCLACVAVCLAGSSVEAAVFTWDGTSAGAAWNDASHWLDAGGNPGTMPGAGDIANVNSGMVVTDGNNFTAQMNINPGGQLGIDGSWPAIQTLHLCGGTLVDGPSPSGLNGKVYVDSHSYLSISAAGLWSTLYGSADLEKTGTSTATIVYAQPNFTGRCIATGGTLQFSTVNGPANSPLIIRNNSSVRLNANASWVLTNDVAGTGSLFYGKTSGLAPLELRGTHVSPGEGGVGSLTVRTGDGGGWGYGDVSLTANGSVHSQLVMDLASAGGVAGIDYDQLVVRGETKLAANQKVNLHLGTGATDLLVHVASNLTAADMLGQTLTIVSLAGGGVLDGTFANIDFTGPLMAQTVTYNTTSITLSNWVAVPEPSTLVLLAMTGLAWLRRRTA